MSTSLYISHHICLVFAMYRYIFTHMYVNANIRVYFDGFQPFQEICCRRMSDFTSMYQYIRHIRAHICLQMQTYVCLFLHQSVTFDLYPLLTMFSPTYVCIVFYMSPFAAKKAYMYWNLLTYTDKNIYTRVIFSDII